jgi:hypothetical protein
LEGQHAGRAAVKSRFEGLAVLSNRGAMLEARVHIAIPDQEAALWLQGRVAEIVRKFDHLHLLARLLVL